jgi:tetratricopeptide (TPR) repeat protein
MNKLLLSLLIVTATNLLLLSCSQTTANKVVKKGPASSEGHSLVDVRAKLDKLVEAAQKSGQSSIDYLASDFFLKASAAQTGGDYATANLLYTYLLKLTSDSFVKTKFAVSLIRAGELEKSEKYLREVYVESGYTKSKIGLVLAGVYTGLNKVEQARKTYKKILVKDSKNEDACVFLSKSFALEDKITKARQTLEKCERRDRKKGIYSYYIGKLYVDKGKMKKAKRYFQRSLKKEANFSRSVLALGLIYEEKDKQKKAVAVYKKFLKKQPNDKLILSRIVQVLFQLSQYKSVIPYAEKLSDIDSDNLNLKVKLGVLYTDAKEFPKAVSMFKELLKVAPKSDKILYYLGAIFQETRQYENSIEYFNKIADSSALFQDSSVQVASMLSKMANMEKYSEEEKDEFGEKFEKFVDLRMKKFPTLKVSFSVIKATYLESKNRNDESVKLLEVVQNDEKFNKDHRYYLASLYEKIKKFEQAYTLVEAMIKKDPKDSYAWNFIGYSYLERGIKLDEAFKYISKARELKPKDGYVLDSLGWYYYKTGSYEKALETLAKAIKMAPKDVTITKHYATVLRKVKKFDLAKKHLVKALSFAKGSSERKALYDELKNLEQIRLPAAKLEK